MSKANIKAYEQAVERLRGLLSRWLEAGVDLFVEINKIEQSGIWRTPLHATFGDFLAAEFPNHALSLERYNHVVEAIAVHGIKRVRELGVEACHAMITPRLVRDQEKRQEFHASVDRYISDKKTPPPVAEVRRIVRGIVEEPAQVASVTKQVRRDNGLAEENAQLRQELQAANRRIRELERENAALKRKLGGGQMKTQNPA